MKRFIVGFIIFSALVLTHAAAQSNAAAEISFSFTRQGGIGTDQFAVWIEDTQGHYLKTVFATRFGASRGWREKVTPIPQWAKNSKRATMPKDQVDALTGATPSTGKLTYTWDGTDSENKALPSGDYVISLEGSLRMWNRVMYRSTIHLGQGVSTPEVAGQYFGDNIKERAMISNVVVKTLR